MRRLFKGSTNTEIATLALVFAIFLIGDITSVSAAPPTEKKCDDGIDNDRDGLTDADDPDCSGSGGGGNTGNGQDAPADVYLYHGNSYGIRGDQWFTGGDPDLNPGGVATIYPANNTLSGTYSCARAIITDQDPGHVRMFVPPGNISECTAVNRLIRIQSDYDLDQDGLCVIPYSGRENARGFQRDYGCSGGVEPDGLEDVMATIHLFEAFSSEGTTPVEIQVRILDYGEDYTPNGASDPGLADIDFIGAQERAYVITLDGVTTSVPDLEDAEVRVFENQLGTATMCEVAWKNAKAHNCVTIEDGNGNPVEITGLTIKGKVDPTPLP